MKKQLVLIFLGVLLMMTGCAETHFGVRDKAVIVPDEFTQTEEAIAGAAKSSGAKYCPEKIAKANAMGKQAMDEYWACHTDKAMDMLAQARKLAADAKACQPPPAPAPRPAPAPVVVPPARQPVSFHSVYFNFNKSDLTAATRAELDKAAKILKDNPDEVLELQGNTDAMGSDAYNKKLGDRRAKSVMDYLISKGISADRLKTVSFGLAKPVAPNTTEEGRAKNRRVDLVILK